MITVNTNYSIIKNCSFRDLTKLGNGGKTISRVTLEKDDIQRIPNPQIKSVINGTVHLIRYNTQALEPEYDGSGFFFDPDGWLLTANHIVLDKEMLLVDRSLVNPIPTTKELLEEHEKGNLQFVNVAHRSTELDLALLKVTQPQPNEFLTFAENALQEGEYCHSVGMNGIKTGQVLEYLERNNASLKAHEWTKKIGIGNPSAENIWRGNIIETTLPLEPKDSGGPLVNSNARVSGVAQGGDKPSIRLFDAIFYYLISREQKTKNKNRSEERQVELPIQARSHFANLDRVDEFFRQLGFTLESVMAKNSPSRVNKLFKRSRRFQ